MKKYNVLITGGLGLIGTHVAKKFANDKNVKKIICLDHFGKYINPIKKNKLNIGANCLTISIK